jgi:hypothetical protein
MGNVFSAARRLVQIHQTVLDEHSSGQTDIAVVHRNLKSASGVAPRFSRIPVRLSLHVLRRDLAELHPDEEFNSLGIPTQYEAAGSFHAKFEIRLAGRDYARAEDFVKLRHHDSTVGFQERFRFLLRG